MLRGIIPIVITAFDEAGQIDEDSLRRVVQFELDGGADAIGVGGFASEAYKLSDAERLRCAKIVADTVAGRVPLVIGIAPGSLEVALAQAEQYAPLQAAALMTLPPSTMTHESQTLVDFYVELGQASQTPIKVQQSPQIAAYAHTLLNAEHLAEIASRAPNVHYFKIEGKGAPERITNLRRLVGERVGLFGGVGGLTLLDELRAGANGLLPGVGFNDVFHRVWAAWTASDEAGATAMLQAAQPLIDAVSGRGHEFSLHARKHLLYRAGIISTPYVRKPTVTADAAALEQVIKLAANLKN